MMMHQSQLFSVLELPFLGAAVFLAFLVAIKLRGGAFGRGMLYLAWGFVVMAIGHVHMQIEYYTGVNVLDSLLGPRIGTVAWILALVVTWGLSAYGFLLVYRAAKNV